MKNSEDYDNGYGDGFKNGYGEGYKNRKLVEYSDLKSNRLKFLFYGIGLGMLLNASLWLFIS